MHRRADGGNVGVAVRVLVVVSTATPTCARRDPMDERACSPMPPVNTSASSPPTAAVIAAISRYSWWIKPSNASAQAGSAAARLASRSRRTPEVPDRPVRPERVSSSSSTDTTPCCSSHISNPLLAGARGAPSAVPRTSGLQPSRRAACAQRVGIEHATWRRRAKRCSSNPSRLRPLRPRALRPNPRRSGRACAAPLACGQAAYQPQPDRT
jgi:hypothetical protein